MQWLTTALGALRAVLPGELTLPGVSAPRGPKFSEEGAEREVWSNAAAFAGIEEGAAP